MGKYNPFHAPQIGRFSVEAEIGRGGMGVVYRAFDPLLGRRVAIKMLDRHLQPREESRLRLQREAAAIAALKHPHIAAVYEFAEQESQPYIVMEWVEGRSLKDLLAVEGPMPLGRARRIFAQLTDALDYAHTRGVIHRDIKPSNIVIGPDDHAVLVDFGLARLTTAASLTASDTILGSPQYMPPEQIRGEPLGPAADVYSLGVTLYEMLAGQPPFAEPTVHALFYKHLHVLPPPLREFAPHLPPFVEAALNKALAKKPQDRFQTAGEFRAALEAETHPPSPTVGFVSEKDRPVPAPKPKRKAIRAAWLLPLLLVCLALSGIFLGTVFFLGVASQSETGSPTSASLPSFAPPQSDGLWPMIGGDEAHTGFVSQGSAHLIPSHTGIALPSPLMARDSWQQTDM